MASPRTAAEKPAGPSRWGFRSYTVAEHRSPRARRYVITAPDNAVVAEYTTRKDTKDALFYTKEGTAREDLFRLVPKRLATYAAAFDVVDASSGDRFGEIRKKEYRTEKKEEWFIHDGDGEPLGMATRNPSRAGRLQDLTMMRTMFPETFALHWGQTICGSIERKTNAIGSERLVVDLSLDQKGDIDRRLVLGLALAIQDEAHLTSLAAPD